MEIDGIIFMKNKKKFAMVSTFLQGGTDMENLMGRLDDWKKVGASSGCCSQHYYLKALALAASLFAIAAFCARADDGVRAVRTLDENFDGTGHEIGLPDSGVSWNAKDLFGDNRGAFFFDVVFHDVKKHGRGWHNLLTLRGRGGVRVSFMLSDARAVQFWYTEGEKRFISTVATGVPVDEQHSFGVSWDGTDVKICRDGRIVDTCVQMLPLEKKDLTLLRTGPFEVDGYMACAPWTDDVTVCRVRTWNGPLAPQDIAADVGISFSGVATELPTTLCVTHIPEGQAAPVIDGRADEKSWTYASSMPQLVRLNFHGKSGEMPPHGFRLIYDNDNLYLLSITHFPGRVPFVEGLQRTEALEPQSCGVEAWEFYLWIGKEKYRFSSTAAGGTSDSKGLDYGWNPGWSCAQTRATQIDDSVIWTSEAAFPWKIFGLDGPPKEEIRINFCRNWTLATFGSFSSLDFNGKEYGLNETLPRVTFSPCASYQLVHRTDPSSGRYDEKYELSADRKGQLIYEVHLATRDGSQAPRSAFRRAYMVSAGETVSDALSVSTALPGYDAIVHTLKQDGKVVMRESVPYDLDPEIVVVTPLLLSKKVRIGFKKAFSGRIVLEGPGGKVFADVASDGSQTEIAFPRRNPAGGYALKFVDAKGKIVAEKAFDYPGIGEWENRDWHEDWILPQFEPLTTEVTAAGFTSKFYGRTYVWEKSYLPTHMSSLDEELLAGPVEILIDGRPVVPFEFSVTSNRPHHVGFASKGAEADVTGWLEYDGVNFNRVTVRPSGVGDVKVRYRLRGAFAKYLHAASGSGWGAKLTDRVKDGPSTVGKFPVFWIGNEEKGLCFFYESRANWTGDEARTYRLEKNADELVVTVDIAKKIKKSELFSFEFGLIATPVKRLQSNYPFNTLGNSHYSPLNRPSQRRLNDVSLLEIDGVEWGDHGSFLGDQDTPDGHKCANAIRAAIDKLEKGHGARPVPYLNACHLSIRYPEVAAFLNDWMVKPEDAMDYNRTGHYVYNLCPTTLASDFGVWRTELMFKRNPELMGVYFDYGIVKGCSNIDHGCCDKVPLLAMREYYRRYIVIQVERGIKEPVVVIHNTDCVQLPAETFVTHLLNGEHLWPQTSSNLHDNRDILDSYSLPMFACELSSLPWGIANSVYMPFDGVGPAFEKYGVKGEAKEDYHFRMGKASIGACLVHNTMQCMWRNHIGIFDRLIRRMDGFGVGKPGMRFIGYWREPAVVRSVDNVCVSCWTDGTKILAAIARIDPSHEDVDIVIDFSPVIKTLRNGELAAGNARDLMEMEDTDYGWLYEANKGPVHAGYNRAGRVSLKMGSFGTRIDGFDGEKLKYHLPHHTFGLVELE